MSWSDAIVSCIGYICLAVIIIYSIYRNTR